ncbi:MAG: alpha/beta hydrolase [Notoacmeibacter sp.]|nr:alpha/beta hydrolase [Notoacmeibacter sp.]
MQIVLAFLLAGFLLLMLLSAYNAWKTRRIAAVAEATVPPDGTFVSAAGRRFHVVEQGEGPAILFVHGLGGNLHHFDIPLWASMGTGYRLVAADRRGSGYSEHHWGDDGRLTTHASDLVALMDALGIEKAVLCGHSLGGAVALATALDHPSRVAGLALLAPLTAHAAHLPAAFRPLYIPNASVRRFIANTYAVPASVRTAKETLDFVFGPQQPPDDFAIAGKALVGLRPSHFDATSTDLVHVSRDLPSLEKRYGEIAVPSGVLFGTEDRVVDPMANGTALAGRIPGIDIELLEGVGHMPQYAEPQRVAAFVRRIAARAFSQTDAGRA